MDNPLLCSQLSLKPDRHFCFLFLNFTSNVNCFCVRGCVEEVVCRKLCYLLNNKILNSFVKLPSLHTSRKLQTNVLVDVQQGQQQHHLFSTLPFGFKLPFILEPAIRQLELPFSQSSYGLFLLVFPPQLDNPHCQVQIPFHLQRKPSVNQDVGYPTCVLELLRAAEPFNVDSTLQKVSLSYLKTIHGLFTFSISTVLIILQRYSKVFD